MASTAVQLRALEDELRLVLEQKALLEQQLTTLRGGGRPGLPQLKTLKRGAPGIPAKTHVPPTKKQKVEEREKRIQSLWGQMGTVLKQVSKQRDAAHFLSPVDAQKLKVPDYYKIVKRPMDLGTIKNKLEHKPERGQPRAYKDPYEFCADVRQVWENCRIYNPEGHPVRQMGDRLSDAWEKKWQTSQIEAKWETLVREQKELELGPAIVPHRMKEMGAELQELTGLVPDGGASGPRQLSFEDKRRLSQALGGLPGERLHKVLDIISRSAAAPVNEDGEAEVDIDTLDNATLLQLEEYVASVTEELQKKHQPPSKTAGQPAKQADQETSSRPLDAAAGTAAAAAGGGGPAAASQPAQGAVAAKSPAGAPTAPRQASASSRSSASSGSSSSSDDSMGEVGSKHEGDSADANKRAETAADQSTLVSATHTQQPPPIYQPKSRKDVTLQNEGAWGALAAGKPAEQNKEGAAAADGAGGAAPAGSGGPVSSAPGEQDALWSEFASREAQQRKREQEKAAEEQRRQAEKAKVEEDARKEADARRAEAEAAAAAERHKEAEAAAAKEAHLEEQRRKEMAALQGAGDAADVGGQDIMRGFGGGGGALEALGFFKKKDDDDDDDDDSDDDSSDDKSGDGGSGGGAEKEAGEDGEVM